MQKLLIPVDGSERSEAAVALAIKRAAAGHPAQVHLLNVQPNVFPEGSLFYIEPTRLDTYFYEQSEKALQRSERMLRDAAMDFQVHRTVGPVAETIVEKAHELSCDGILMSTRGHGSVIGMLLGSVANKVLHLSDVPVTLIRPPVETGKTIDITGRLSAT
ncbi:MAG TPA: universal stress protein [Burkholderiales bacterium]|nr:universal stress protein [Burkholderiales bacterium]